VTDWIPGWYRPIAKDYALNSAWYSGDPETLANLYSATFSLPPNVTGDFLKSTIRQARQNYFWAQQSSDERRTCVHVPCAGDIASTSANLLFGEQPAIKCENESAGKRLQEIIDESGFEALLLEAAEIAAAMGDVYLKINWDKTRKKYPILSVAQPDNVLPTFWNGILTEASFIRVLEIGEKGEVWRLVETHKPGQILTSLYLGDGEKLGLPVDMSLRPETRDIAPVVATQLPGLACAHVPNIKPNRKHRGIDLGRSDFAGLYSLMDSLDESISNLMNDIELGRGHALIPEAFLDTDSDGNQTWDAMRTAFVKLAIPVSDAAGVDQIMVVQHAIRMAEHLGSAEWFLRRIFAGAGYSPQTFGLDIDGQAESGTALKIREGKSAATVAKKALYWKPALRNILGAMLTIDRVQLGNSTPDSAVSVEIQDGSGSSLQETANSVKLLADARAASVKTIVSMVHPDWDEAQVDAEVALILDEDGRGVPDVMQAGVA
jgi:A118 family predicted phage portal protein